MANDLSSFLKTPWKVLTWLSLFSRSNPQLRTREMWGTNQVYWQRIATAKTLRKRVSPTLRNPQSTLKLDAWWKISWRCKRERNRVQHVSLSLSPSISSSLFLFQWTFLCLLLKFDSPCALPCEPFYSFR